MALSRAMAQLAIETLADVFTPEGDGVVIDRFTGTHGVLVVVNGRLHHEQRYPITALTPSRDLLAFAERDGIV